MGYQSTEYTIPTIEGVRGEPQTSKVIIEVKYQVGVAEEHTYPYVLANNPKMAYTILDFQRKVIFGPWQLTCDIAY